MRILLVAPSAFPVCTNSRWPTEKLIYQLAQGLRDRGHQVTVAATTESAVPDGVQLLPTVPSMAVPTAQGDALAHRVMRDMFPAFDIVHDHSTFLYAYLYKRDRPQFKLCATLHGWEQFRTLPAGVQKPNFICLSQRQAEHYQITSGAVCRVIHPGVDLAEFKPSDKGDRFLFLAPITPQSGALHAIDIARRARVPLDVAGNDRFVQDVGYVHRCMDACDRSDIRYVGEVDEAGRKRLLAGAKGLIHPAIDEPFGLVALEALASGTPMVCLRGSGTAEAVGRRANFLSGFACDSYDEMAEAVLRVDAIRAEDCRRRAGRFSLATMCDRHEAAYREAISGGW